MPQLEVSVVVKPHPETMRAEDFDKLLDGELAAFERWFIQSQRDKGNTNPSGLISAERAIVKTYILYMSTKDRTQEP